MAWSRGESSTYHIIIIMTPVIVVVFRTCMDKHELQRDLVCLCIVFSDDSCKRSSRLRITFDSVDMRDKIFRWENMVWKAKRENLHVKSKNKNLKILSQLDLWSGYCGDPALASYHMIVIVWIDFRQVPWDGANTFDSNVDCIPSTYLWEEGRHSSHHWMTAGVR